MNTKIILLSAFVILGALTFGHAVYAANATLSVLPATASKNVGTAFNVSVNLDPQGNKVCVVKGILNFDDLTCKGITVASGLMAQTTPTCSSPSFTLGIPKCTTSAQNILSVLTKGNSIGQAKVLLANVKVIGVGVIVASATNDGAYNITAVPVPTTAPSPTPQVTSPVPSPVPAPTQQSSAQNQQASLANASPTKTIVIVVIIILAIIIIGGLWYVASKKKKNKEVK
jgi:hypothetical protein